MLPAPHVQAAQFEENSSLDSITIPQGPRLGSEVIHLEGVCKSYGDRLLMDQVNLDIPAGSVVGECSAGGDAVDGVGQGGGLLPLCTRSWTRSTWTSQPAVSWVSAVLVVMLQMVSGRVGCCFPCVPAHGPGQPGHPCWQCRG